MNLKAVPLLQRVGTRIYQSITTAVLKQRMKFLTILTRTMNSCKICSVAKLEGRASVTVEFCQGGPQSAQQLASPMKTISLERPQSQGVHRVLKATAVLSIVLDMQF